MSFVAIPGHGRHAMRAERAEFLRQIIIITDDHAPFPRGHIFIGENGDIEAKMNDFRDAVMQNSDKIDIAFMKFCYIDVDEKTDIKVDISTTTSSQTVTATFDIILVDN